MCGRDRITSTVQCSAPHLKVIALPPAEAEDVHAPGEAVRAAHFRPPQDELGQPHTPEDAAEHALSRPFIEYGRRESEEATEKAEHAVAAGDVDQLEGFA